MSSKQLEKVNDARDLLDMLEYVLASGGAVIETEKFPLSGLQLTVRHISRHLVELERLIREGSSPQERPKQAPSHPHSSPQTERRVESRGENNPENGMNGGITSRIQMAPVPRNNRRGYTREISSEAVSRSQDVPSGE